MSLAIKLCPRCKCNACYPLHRKGLDWAIYLLGLRPARCLTCMKKFYTRYTIVSAEPSRKIFAPGSTPVRLDSNPQKSPDRSRAA